MAPDSPRSNPAVLQLDHIRIRLQDRTAFEDTSWTVHQGEHWAITGPNGSGKTVLLETLLGLHPVISGSIRYPFLQNLKSEKGASSPLEQIARVSFSTAAIMRRHPDMYYQQRFYSTETQGTTPVRDLLQAASPELPVRYAEILGISHLLDRQANQLSNGETKKILILRALLRDPRLLLLDQPLDGLDAESRQMVSELIDRVATRGITIILATAKEELPASITQVLSVQELRVVSKSRASDFSFPAAMRTQPAPGKPSFPGILSDFRIPEFREAVRMEQVRVRYNGLEVLRGIDWVVRKGERWALSGPNGSGKSTLLSLIFADHPQAYSNDLWIFDRKRGSGETIWEIKQKIGYVSPEWHGFIPGRWKVGEIRPPGVFPGKDFSGKVRAILEYLGLPVDQELRFGQLSSAQQRLLLLAVAVATGPALLILDEPCQGLDPQHRDLVKGMIDELAARSCITLIYVSHEQEDIPSCVNNHFRISGGRRQDHRIGESKS